MILSWIGKISGWMNAVGVMLVILKVFYAELVDFITKAVIVGNKILEEWKKQGVDQATISAKKKELAANVDAEAKMFFSGSPSIVRGALIEVVRGLVVTHLRLQQNEERGMDDFAIMQADHPVSNHEIEMAKKTYPMLFGDDSKS